MLKQINKHNARKVIDLNAYRQQKKATEELFNQIIKTETAIKTGHDPLHAVYTPRGQLFGFFKITGSS